MITLNIKQRSKALAALKWAIETAEEEARSPRMLDDATEAEAARKEALGIAETLRDLRTRLAQGNLVRDEILIM